MKISQKIAAGLGGMTLALAVAGGAGYLGTSRLVESVHFLMGPAWDTADGAMEGKIGLQQQMILMGEMAAGAKGGALKVPEGLAEVESGADDAFARMIAAGQVPKGQVDAIRAAIAEFKGNRDALRQASEAYAAAFGKMTENTNRFVGLMGLVEEVGDAQVEALAQDPDQFLTWRVIGERWTAADGSMEARIALLTRLRQYQQLVDGALSVEQAQGELSASLGELEANVAELAELSMFDDQVPSGEFAGKSYNEALGGLLGEHREVFNQAVAAYAAFHTARLAFTEASQLLAERLEALEEVTDAAVEGEAENVANAEATAFTLIAGAFIAGLAMAGLFITLSNRMIIQPICEVAQRLNEIGRGEGDLGVRLPEKGDDEMTAIARGFNHFVEKIHATIREVADSTGRLTAAAAQLSTITEQTSANILSQTSETEQVATAMNEMSATVREVAGNAAGAAESAQEADGATGEGRRVVATTITTINGLAGEVERAAEVIHRLEEDSENIGTVLDVIRGIAEQTNLLALNAAIEAARAGEQGRGFAVVADEVRTLASRTQESTEEIQSMIQKLQAGSRDAVAVMGASRERAEEGVRQVSEAGSALDRIAAAVSSINDMNALIASAAEEQSAVAEEMNRNIVHINDLSSQNGQGAQQTAGASHELAQLADNLQRLVSQFRI